MKSSTNSNSPADLDKLQARLCYAFADPRLLTQALTHKSHGPKHNERLEFLGDAVLGYVVADWLFTHRTELSEDALTLLRASLVRRDTLAEVARELKLGDYLLLGLGERKSGGSKRKSILSDALEAVIGAIHEDGGIEPAREFVHRLLAERARLLDHELEKDAKTRLQERLQGMALGLPVYAVVAETGADHAREFKISCRVADLDLEVSACGSSRRTAEKAAAALMLEEVERCLKS